MVLLDVRDFHALAAPQQATEIAIAQSYQITQYGAIALATI